MKRFLGMGLGLLAAFWLSAGNAAAADDRVLSDLALNGIWRQGGLVTGQAPPGTQVYLDGVELRLDEEGRFLFGFDRDQPPEARLWIVYPGGRQENRILEVAQRDYEIERIDGLPPRYVAPPEEVQERIAREREMVAAVRAADRASRDYLTGWVWPAEGRISGVYGSQRILNGEPRQPHYGVDVAAPVGTSVRAPADGIVVLAEEDLYYSGGTLIIDHGAGLTSAFLHLDSLSVDVGEEVEKGERIGRLGETGRASGPHLDWRINWFDRRIDPQLLVGPMPVETD